MNVHLKNAYENLQKARKNLEMAMRHARLDRDHDEHPIVDLENSVSHLEDEAEEYVTFYGDFKNSPLGRKRAEKFGDGHKVREKRFADRRVWAVKAVFGPGIELTEKAYFDNGDLAYWVKG